MTELYPGCETDSSKWAYQRTSESSESIRHKTALLNKVELVSTRLPVHNDKPYVGAESGVDIIVVHSSTVTSSSNRPVIYSSRCF